MHASNWLCGHWHSKRRPTGVLELPEEVASRPDSIAANFVHISQPQQDGGRQAECEMRCEEVRSGGEGVSQVRQGPRGLGSDGLVAGSKGLSNGRMTVQEETVVLKCRSLQPNYDTVPWQLVVNKTTSHIREEIVKFQPRLLGRYT